jgi:mycoredoxin
VEVDVEADADAAAVLAGINDGHLTVPTVQFVDGSSLTNPGVEAVSEKLARLAPPGASPAG